MGAQATQSVREVRVNVHQNAKLTPRGRESLVRYVCDRGTSYWEAARDFGVDVRTVRRWVERYRDQGRAGLADRSCRPRRSPRRVSRAIRRRLCRRRVRERLTMDELARAEGVSRATVARVLARAGLSRLGAIDPKPPVQRYEHAVPGALVHLDIKQLGRFHRPGHRVSGQRRGRSRHAGWEYAHVAIDDHSRVGHGTVWPDASAASAWRALIGVVRFFRTLGVRIERVLTDNGACYLSRRFQRVCRRLGIRHRRTRPYRPRTNGKAERFIQTALREWAYAHRYQTNTERTAWLPRWLHHYNWHRRHGSLGYRPPITRLGLSEDNLVRLHI